MGFIFGLATVVAIATYFYLKWVAHENELEGIDSARRIDAAFKILEEAMANGAFADVPRLIESNSVLPETTLVVPMPPVKPPKTEFEEIKEVAETFLRHRCR